MSQKRSGGGKNLVHLPEIRVLSLVTIVTELTSSIQLSRENSRLRAQTHGAHHIVKYRLNCSARVPPEHKQTYG